MAFASTTKTFDQMDSDNCSHLCCPIDLKILMTRLEQIASVDEKTSAIVRTLNPKKCNFNAPAIRKNFFSKFDKYNILALS